MTSELHRYRHRSQMEFAEDQSVEQFAGRTAVVTLGVVAVFTTLIAGNLRQRRIRIGVFVIVVGMVVPAGATDVQTEVGAIEHRSEESRGGKECVSPCRSRG